MSEDLVHVNSGADERTEKSPDHIYAGGCAVLIISAIVAVTLLAVGAMQPSKWLEFWLWILVGTDSFYGIIREYSGDRTQASPTKKDA